MRRDRSRARPGRRRTRWAGPTRCAPPWWRDRIERHKSVANLQTSRKDKRRLMFHDTMTLLCLTNSEIQCFRSEQGDQWVCENVAQFVAKPFFLSKWVHNWYCGKKKSQNLLYFCNFQTTAQSKQSPNRRKIAQSGHPVPKDSTTPTSPNKLACFATNSPHRVLLQMAQTSGLALQPTKSQSSFSLFRVQWTLQHWTQNEMHLR
jgi:hypothetical protein